MSSIEQKKKVQSYFDDDSGWQGEVYTTKQDQFSKHVVRRRDYNLRMIEKLSVPPDGVALDIGCGSGVYIPELVKMGYHVVGMDYSLEMVKKSRELVRGQNIESHVDYLAGDIDLIPFPDCSFDLILCIGVLGYLLHDEKALKGMYRILKPGGHIVLNLSNTYQLYNLDYLLRSETRKLLGMKPLHNFEESQPGISLTSKWHLENSPTKYRFKTYNLWRFEKWMIDFGYRLTDSRTFGFSMATIRKYHLLPKSFSDRLELFMEDIFSKFKVPYFSYSGATYIGIFRK